MRKILHMMSFVAISLLPSCSSGVEEMAAPSFHFREPLAKWGSTSSEVKSYMDGYGLIAESGYSLTYRGRDSETGYLYAFSGPGIGFCYAVVSFNLSHREALLSFLRNSYQLKGSADGNYVFTDPVRGTVITMTSDDEVYLTYRSQAAFQ